MGMSLGRRTPAARPDSPRPAQALPDPGRTPPLSRAPGPLLPRPREARPETGTASYPRK